MLAPFNVDCFVGVGASSVTRANAGLYAGLAIGPLTDRAGQEATPSFVLCTLHSTFHWLLSVHVLDRYTLIGAGI